MTPHGVELHCPECGYQVPPGQGDEPCARCGYGKIDDSQPSTLMKGDNNMSEAIPVPCVECVGLQEALDHEAAMAAMFQEALEEIIEAETKRLDLASDGGDNPIETPAAATAFAALGAYTVAQEQFSKRRSLPLPDDREDDDIPF